MKATLLTGLTPQSAAAGEHQEPFGTLQHVAHFPFPGVVCKIMLGAAGLQYRRGDTVAAIPTAELIALFEKTVPAFAAKPDAPAPAAKSPAPEPRS